MVSLIVAVMAAPGHAAAPEAASRPGWLSPDAALVELTDLSQLPGARGTATAAQQAVTPQTVYYFKAIKNSYGLQCLDGDLNTIGRKGAVVQLWSCNEWDNQMWYYTPVSGRAGVYTIRNAHGGQCLDGDSNTIGRNGTKVQLWTCHGGDNQMWTPVCGLCPAPPPGTIPTWTIQNVRGGQCLDGDRNTIPNAGAKVQLWACNGWDNQAWRQVFDHSTG